MKIIKTVSLKSLFRQRFNVQKDFIFHQISLIIHIFSQKMKLKFLKNHKQLKEFLKEIALGRALLLKRLKVLNSYQGWVNRTKYL
jgi:hypothetical protein